MKKALRDIKRGVNKKVLKVPSIEQKVLDATSNESWGPHGTHLADIAQASRNYHEYQMIMSVVWKRLNDTGKNWRHVYKALTVLEYLVANGSERVIEDIKDHAYQLSALSNFQYIDSTGRDQGSNIRKKSQSLVAFVNDKEKIQEAREKAVASRDKFRNTSGGLGDEDHNGYGRERDRNYRDSYGRDDGYGDDEYGAKSQSSDRDDGYHSSRGSNARVEEGSPDGSRIESKLSGQNLGAPPSYEHVMSEGETAPTPAAATPPPAAASSSVTSNDETDGFDFFDPRGAPPAATSESGGAEVDLFGSLSDSFSSDILALVPSETQAPTNANPSQTFVAASPTSQQFDDPFGDGPFRAVPSTDAFSAHQSTSPFTEPHQTLAQTTVNGMGFDGFSAQHSTSPFTDPPQTVAQTTVNDMGFDAFSAQQSPSPFTEPHQTVSQTTVNDMGFGDSFDETVDILAGILPPTGPPSVPSQAVTQAEPHQPSTQISFPSQTGQPYQTPFSSSFPAQFGQPMTQSTFQVQGGYQSIPPPSFPAAQDGQSMLPPGFPVSQGGQPMLPSGVLASQGGQPMSRPGFPASQGVQSELQPGFLASHGGQSALLSTSQGGHSMLPPGYPASQGGQSVLPPGPLASQGGQSELPLSFPASQGGQSELQPGFLASQGGQSMLPPGYPVSQGSQSALLSTSQGSQSVLPLDFAGSQNASPGGISSQTSTLSHAQFPNSNGQTSQPNNNPFGGFQPQGQPPSAPTPPTVTNSSFHQPPQLQSSTSMPTSVPSVTASTVAVAPQPPAKEKFETKSTVWADTLNRGLVNLNISGSKTNPLSDIGIDFEAINRKEKRMEKPSKIPVTSNVAMGKAMGSGSGMGRAGALRPALNPMVGSGMGMGAPGAGPAFGAGYGGAIQPMGMNNMPQNTGLRMNGGHGFQMQPRPVAGYLPPGSYNPMMGNGGGYGQQPYGSY